MDPERYSLVMRQPIEHIGNFPRDPRPHQDKVDPGQHRPVQRSEIGQLDFLEHVDPDRAGDFPAAGV